MFEYVFGLGKWLSASFPLVSFDKHLKADEVTPIGFELMDACFFDTSGYNKKELAVKLGMSTASLYNKLNDSDKFTFLEIRKLFSIMRLTPTQSQMVM